MSAIWGLIQKNHELMSNSSSMKDCYKRKCVLDRINEETTKTQLFGCGIQYITEESKGEQLPIYSKENELLFTADCILDNRDELITKLGIKDAKAPDGTIMYQAYLKWGYDCVKHFHGLYSIAAYDRTTDTLFLATDPTASRCLYYYQNADGCTFSTLIEPILQLHPDIRKNELYIEDYLIAPGLRPNLSATETPYEDIYKLEAGTYLILKDHQKQIHHYWKPATLPLKIKMPEQCKEQFITVFKKCVHNAVRTSGEVGMALSSGFDSSSVAAFAALDLEKSKKDLYSYTYVPYYDGASDKHVSYFVIDETEAVLKTASLYPNIKPTFLNTEGKDFYQSLDQILSIMEIPMKAFVNLPSLQELFATAAANKCKVFLTGQYGNATISYGNIDNILYEMYSHKHFISYLLTLNSYCKKARESRKVALRQCRRYYRHTHLVLNSKPTIEKMKPDNPFLNKELVANFPYEARYANEKLPIGEKVALPKYLYEEYLYNTSALTYLGEYETKFGLANGILIRDPTRDPDILSFCHTIPYKFFAYNGNTRWLVREGLREYLPKEIVAPYLRYGLQNADWAYRVALNWENVYNSLKANLASPALANYIDTTEVNTFLKEVEESFTESNYDISLYIFILDVLSRFLS